MVQQSVSFALECKATISARMVREDYGVSGSPVWYSPEDIDFCDAKVWFDDVEVSLKDLPDNLQDKLLSLAIEESEYNEWESDDE